MRRLRGGANRIAQGMRDQLPPDKIKQGMCVTKITPYRPKPEKAAEALYVHVHQEETRKYSHVISTIPLGCVRMVDLEECRLSYALREALRSLQYGPSVKIGMKFRRRWWEDPEHSNKGGVSSTDRFVKINSLFL